MSRESEYTLKPFTGCDAAEVAVLQRCCWVPEAVLNDTLNIPALHESVDDVLRWPESWETLCLRNGGRLVGAVRGQTTRDGSWEIGRLMVAPDLASQGLGRWLLRAGERLAPDETTRFVLFTGVKSERNIRIYQQAGYEICEPPSTNSEHIAGTVFLARPAPRPRAAASST
ncbi:GNAT family N-acetyltransferase [Brevibacterium picturae]|uniref:GNAT family N-acetyltransferase n=1 Tax=Brevibacterium picturae TaxID=260553 RepID=A0ABP4NCD2_9MICO